MGSGAGAGGGWPHRHGGGAGKEVSVHLQVQLISNVDGLAIGEGVGRDRRAGDHEAVVTADDGREGSDAHRALAPPAGVAGSQRQVDGAGARAGGSGYGEVIIKHSHTDDIGNDRYAQRRGIHQ